METGDDLLPDDPERLAAHALAVSVAEPLRAKGLPVMGVELFDAGFKIGVAFRMPAGTPRAGKLLAFAFPKDAALADPGLFERAYEEACRA